jgi:hypothetical protein
LFEEPDGLDNIVSTSSIIEGVNTSAENVVIWRNKNGSLNLNDFTYKNIIGRGGRMFRHFVGQIFLLEPPPDEKQTELELPFPDEILGNIDEETFKEELSDAQIKVIADFKESMYDLVGMEPFEKLLRENSLQLSNAKYIHKIAFDMKYSPEEWSGLGGLNSDNPKYWGSALHKALEMRNVAEVKYGNFVRFVQALSANWYKPIPRLLFELDEAEISIETFFQLERNAAFKLSSLLSDINNLQSVIFDKGLDISSFVFKLSHVFLPPVVYQLEEYGLPRMLSRRLQTSGIIDFENPELRIHDAIRIFHTIGKDHLHAVPGWEAFDHYILDFFFEGITTEVRAGTAV